MEPYVLHWLEGVEHEYHEHHPPTPRKTDYVYFIRPSAGKAADSSRLPRLDRNKLMVLGPRILMSETGPTPMLAELEAQDVKRLLEFIFHYPRQLFEELFDGASSRGLKPETGSVGEGGWSKTGLEGSGEEVGERGEEAGKEAWATCPPNGHLYHHYHHGEGRRLSILDLRESPLSSKSEPHLLRKEAARITWQRVAILSCPPSRGLLELFHEPDLAEYLLQRRRTRRNIY